MPLWVIDVCGASLVGFTAGGVICSLLAYGIGNKDGFQAGHASAQQSNDWFREQTTASRARLNREHHHDRINHTCTALCPNNDQHDSALNWGY